MADENTPLWHVAKLRNYKSVEIKLRATMIKNVNDNKKIKYNKYIKPIYYFNADDFYSGGNNILILKPRGTVANKRLLNRYKLLNMLNSKSKGIMFTDFRNNTVFQNNNNTTKLQNVPPFNIHDHNLTMNSGSKNQIKNLFSDTLPYSKLSWKVYRCQLSTQEESCCCSCNSDAMFEVMKSLYDCYKKKNCDNCNCILCGHLPREERRLGELRKSGVEVAVGKKETFSKKRLKSKASSGESSKKKEKILKEMAIAGKPLPEGKTPSEKDLIPKVKATTSKAGRLSTPIEGKSKQEKERILKDLAKQGLPFPEPKTASDQKLVNKIRNEVGLPPEPKTTSAKEKYTRAMAAGLITPLEGKSLSKKEQILREQAKMGLILPEGRTPSEKALIKKVKEKTLPEREMRVPSEKIRKAKAEGLLTPIEGKSKQEKERILKGLAKQGLPLPELKTASDQKLMDRIRNEVGLPPEPKTPSAKEKYDIAMTAGLITPLEGKSIAKKEQILRDQAKIGLLLPEGRTPSEKALIKKVKETTQPEKGGRTPSERALIAKVKEINQPEREVRLPSEKIRKAKAEGLLTPLEGKSKQEKERILKGIAKQGLPLPDLKTASDRKLMDKIRNEFGLPPEPKTPSAKEKYDEAMTAGLITPLEGKSFAKKEQILQDLAKMGLLLPEGRTPSEKALIKKVKESTRPEREVRVPSEKIRKAKAEGLLTPLEGKPKQEKERIVKGLAKQGLPLPEPKTTSDRKLMDRIRNEVGLPPEPKTPSAKKKYERAMAAGLITPLDGKSIAKKEQILRNQAKMGLLLPEGRTPSEKALIEKIKGTSPSLTERPALSPEKIKKLDTKTAKVMKEKKGPSDECICNLLTPESEKQPMGIGFIKIPTKKDTSIKVPSEKILKAKADGLLTPLEGKSKKEKQRILQGLAKQGLPFPEPKTASDQKLMDKIRNEVGLPPAPKTPSAKANYDRAIAAGIITPLEGKSMGKKEKILREQAKLGLPLPEGRTPSEKALIAKVKETSHPQREVRVPLEKINKAKAEGLLTPLKGKPKQEKERILKGLAKLGLPLPEATTASEQKLIEKVRNEVGLPSEPKIPSVKAKYDKAMTAGLITPLGGKSLGKKEKILRDQAKMGLPLPAGRTPSEKALIAKVKETTRPKKEMRIPSEKIRKARADGLLTPLEGKSKKDKEIILKGLAKQGLPLPEPKTASDRKLMDRIRIEVGLPPEPKTTSAKEKYDRAMAAGLITPLEGKSIFKKEQILQDQAKMGLLLPEGRTPSEKALIEEIKGTSPPLTGRSAMPPEKINKLDTKTAKVMKEKKGPSEECICDLLTPESEKQPVGIGIIKMPTKKDTSIKVPSEKIRKAKADGLLTPLEGKSKKDKEKILRGLAKHGLPFPEAKTGSEQKLIDKIRNEVGLPPEPKTSSAKAKYDRAMAAGIIPPLEGKSMGKRERILRDQAKMGLQLPVGRTPSEKALIAKVKETTRPEMVVRMPSEKIRKAKAEGLFTPLAGKSKQEKQRILQGLAKLGLPLPEPKTVSDQKLMDKIRSEAGLPPVPKTPSAKAAYDRAVAAGLITPLEGKSLGKKEQILRDQAKMGVPLPEGRTPSEKALIAKVKETTRPEKEIHIPSEKIRKARADGLLTPLEGKSKKDKERILKGLAKQGLPLPEPKTASDRKLMNTIRKEVGLPPEPKTPSAKEKFDKAMAFGLITPLEGKSLGKKEQILREQAKMGLLLPEGRTPSEKALIKKVKETTYPEKGSRTPSERTLKAKIKETTQPEREMRVPSEKIRKARAEGLLTPLEGKSKQEKEMIIKGLTKQGLPLPEPKTASDRKLMDRIRKEVGLPPEPKTPSAKEKYDRAMAAGLITPLEGKSIAKKEQILRDQDKMGLLLPEGRTPSEKALVQKIKRSSPSLTGRPAFPQEKNKKLDAKTAKIMKYKKGPSDECICDLLTPESEKQPLGIGIIKTPTKDTTIKVPSEKIRKAKAEGLFRSLEGISKKDKENILKGLSDAGLSMPEGATPSEKVLVQKVRATAGLPPEAKSSDRKGKIKQKSKKIGVGGIFEELEDITKTTKCDRGCGCDKKKIRFKHSYVKIRVTSPDISSLCPCPEECVPGVKGGVFTDNEGIKVTIGTAIGVPGFPSREFRESKRKITIRCSDTTFYAFNVNNQNYEKDSPSEHYNISNAVSRQTENINSCLYDSISLDKSYGNFYKADTIKVIKSLSCNYEKPKLLRSEVTEEFFTSKVSTSSSLETIYLLQTDSCLSLTTASDVYSVVSFSITETYSDSDYNIREDCLKYQQIIKSNESSPIHYTSDSALSIKNVYSVETYFTSKILAINPENNFERENLLLTCIRSESSLPEYSLNQRRRRFIMNFKDINSNSGTLETISGILSRISFDDSTSLIVILPSSSDESAADCDYYLDVLDSYLVVQVPEHPKQNHTSHEPRAVGGNKGIKLVTNGKLLKDMSSIESNRNDWCSTCNVPLRDKPNKTCPTSEIIEQKQRLFSSDTTEDRPCCCTPPEGSEDRGSRVKEQKCDNEVELAKPITEAVARGNTNCSACERSKWDGTSSNKNKSRIKDKSKCPCSFGYQIDSSQKTNDTLKGTSNKQKEKMEYKRNNKLNCECAQELAQLLPEFQFSEEDWIDDAQVRKINSDLTQTMSGFKFNVLRKKSQQEMRFEEILKFYADSYEQKYKNFNYSDNGKLQTKINAAADCECPAPAAQQDTSASKAEEPLQGIKFHIGAKGSKGLSGILCF